MNLNSLGDNLKFARNKKNINQLGLAKIAGIDQAVISTIEAGRNKNPKIVTLQSLAGALDVTVGQLIGEDVIGCHAS